MMAAVIDALTNLWPFLLAAGGLIFGFLRHKQAQTEKAQAGKLVADEQAKTAAIKQSEAEANATAARAGAAAVKERTNVENEIAAGPAGESAERLRSDWSRD